MPVPYREVDPKDTAELNAILRQIIEELNRLAGLTGTVQISADIDLMGHRIINQSP